MEMVVVMVGDPNLVMTNILLIIYFKYSDCQIFILPSSGIFLWPIRRQQCLNGIQPISRTLRTPGTLKAAKTVLIPAKETMFEAASFGGLSGL